MKTKMKLFAILPGTIALWLLATAPLTAAEGKTRFDASSGSKMRIEGTSTFHDWQAESTLIIGFLEVGSNFPTEPGQAVSPGKVEATGEASVTVRSLKSVEKDGKDYSDTMNEKMRDMLKQTTSPKIVYRLSELVLKEAPKDNSAPYVFDSKGDLAIAGVTNKISMPISVTVMPGKKIKVSGTAPLKMTDFGIQPSSIIFAKTADDVTIKFDWMLAQRKTPAAAAAK
jgi:polyisoprenoid-binding protein YceI